MKYPARPFRQAPGRPRRTAACCISLLVLALGAGACRKPTPTPTPKQPSPQVTRPADSATPGTPAASGAVAVPTAPGGIAWFQGSIEEGFSRVTAVAGASVASDAARKSALSTAVCLQPLSGDEHCQSSSWHRSVRILSRLLQFAQLGL